MAYRDNVEITEESYVPGGLGVEDYLIPNRPHIDWGNTGVSYAGGFGTSETRTGGRSFGGEPQIDPEDVDLSDVKPARKRRSGLTNGLFTVADLFKISASMPNVYGQSALQPGSAYLGMTEEEANKRAKIRMEEDPEGKEIDINRAKVLSARAAATDDVELKKKYGAAIKQLLPNETQGLDALTASDFFNSTDNKLKLEQIKGFNKLQQIGLQNQGKLDVAGLNNTSREGIAAAKNATQLQVHELDNAIKQAIADGKNDTALALQDKRAELQTMIHEMDNLADYDRDLMKQQHADWRTQYGQDAATNRTQMQQQGAMDRTVYSQDAATNRTRMTQEGALERVQAQQAGALERVKMQQANANLRALVAGKTAAAGKKGDAKAQQAQVMVDYLTSPEQVATFDKLNDAAGEFSWGGETWGTFVGSKRGQAWSQLESYMTRGIVQLAKSLGSNPSNEDARRISNMFGLNSHMSPSRRREAWFDTLRYVAAVSGTGLPVDGSVPPQEALAGAQANIQAPQSRVDITNIEKGKAPTGQPMTASGNYLF